MPEREPPRPPGRPPRRPPRREPPRPPEREPPHLKLTGERLRLTGARVPPPRSRRPLARGVTALLTVALIAVVSVAVLVTGGSAPSPTATMTVGRTPVGSALPSGWVGVSVEYPALLAYAGSDPGRIDPVFISLVRALAGSTGHPILRVGGDSTDHSWWPAANIDPPAGVDYPLTPQWTSVARAVAVRTGARLILGVNLAADDPSLSATEADELVSRIGAGRIAALEIGNEPDIYAQAAFDRTATGQVVYARSSGWDISDYEQEFTQWRTLLPDVPVAGPAFAKAAWTENLGGFLAAEPGVSLVTLHRYPLRNCKGGSGISNAPSPTIPRLLSAFASNGLASDLRPAIAAAHAAGRELRLDEINSASCKGRAGVSDTFASALWILGTMFDLARDGVEGVNVHTLPGAAYAPFRLADTADGWRGHVNPLYYGMLMFSRAFPAGARSLPVRLRGPATVTGWADVGGGADDATRVLLLNRSATRAETVRLDLPGLHSGTLALQRLTAPSVAATSGVRLGGRSFSASTATGLLATPVRAQIAGSGGQFTVAVPAGSAVLLTTS